MLRFRHYSYTPADTTVIYLQTLVHVLWFEHYSYTRADTSVQYLQTLVHVLWFGHSIPVLIHMYNTCRRCATCCGLGILYPSCNIWAITWPFKFGYGEPPEKQWVRSESPKSSFHTNNNTNNNILLSTKYIILQFEFVPAYSVANRGEQRLFLY